jgi:O-antigen ligase
LARATTDPEVGFGYDLPVARKEKKEATPSEPVVRARIWLLAAAFFLVGVAAIPGAASPFRAPKDVLAVTAIVLVAGLSMVAALARGRLAVRWSPVALTLVALPVLQAASASWAASPRLAVASSLHSAVWILGALWIATTSGAEQRRLVLATAAGTAASSLVLLLQAAGWSGLGFDGRGGDDRLVLSGLTGNPADLAMAAVLVLPLVLADIGEVRRRWLHWTLAAVLSLAVVVSQTLTGLAALALVWGVWLIRQRSRRLWIGAAVAVLVAAAAGLATGLDDRLQRQLWRLEHGDWYFLLSARSDGWTAAAEMVRSRPVTGAGAGNFSYAYYPSRVAWVERTGIPGNRSELATHFDLAHCDPLQMVAELGVPGVLWMAVLAVVLVRYRPRGDPLPALAAAAFVPFAALHFPTHLAVGLVPLVLVLGRLLAAGDEVVLAPKPWPRRLLSAALAAAVAAGCIWQLQSLTLNVWRGALEQNLAAADGLEGPARVQRAAAVEAQILPRLPALPGAQPWLWRLVGRARILRGDAAGAEAAFRTAMSLWPHEEAEFGLGLALAAEAERIAAAGVDPGHRRGEAILHLARVCRTNPALLELINDPELRRSVAEIVRGSEAAPESG